MLSLYLNNKLIHIATNGCSRGHLLWYKWLALQSVFYSFKR